jgi:hypothetical protein
MFNDLTCGFCRQQFPNPECINRSHFRTGWKNACEKHPRFYAEEKFLSGFFFIGINKRYGIGPYE